MGLGSGCGSNGNGGGWFSFTGSGTGYNYPVSMATCLINGKYISTDILDPTKQTACGGLECYAYQVVPCTEGTTKVAYIYANLETLPHSSTAVDGTCNPALDDAIGSNYFVKITY